MLLPSLIFSVVLVIISIRRYGKAFNPFTLEAYFTILFMIVPQLILSRTTTWAKESLLSDLVIMLYIASLFLGTCLKIKTYPLKGIQHVRVINLGNALLYSLLVVPLVPYLLSFGLSAAGVREFYEHVVFSKYASFFELSKIILYFLIFFKLIRKERFSTGFYILLPLIFFYGSRFVILDFIIFVCVYLEQFRKLPVRKIAFISAGGAGVILIYSMFQFSYGNLELLFSSYFDIYKNQAFIIDQLVTGKHSYYYGEIQLSSYLKFIPRILWEDKPREFGFAILNYEFFPFEATQGYMPSFGLGSVFADFGFFSIFFTGLFNGFLRNYFYHTLQKSRNNLSFFLYIFPLGMITTTLVIGYLVVDKLLDLAARKETTLSSAR